MDGLPVHVYIDDVLRVTQTEEEGLAVLEQVIDRLKESGLKIGLKKCKCLVKSCRYLGFILSGEGKSVSKEYWEGLKEPGTALDAEAVMGKLEYVRGNIPGFASLVRLAHEIKRGLRKKNPERREVLTYNRPLTPEEKTLLGEIVQTCKNRVIPLVPRVPGNLEVEVHLEEKGGWINITQNKKTVLLESKS